MSDHNRIAVRKKPDRYRFQIIGGEPESARESVTHMAAILDPLGERLREPEHKYVLDAAVDGGITDFDLFQAVWHLPAKAGEQAISDLEAAGFEIVTL